MTLAKPATQPAGKDAAAPISVLCVDDNVLLGTALGRFIGAEPSLRWLGAVSDGGDAAPAAKRLKPDVVLMDIDIPGFDMFRVVEDLSTTLPMTRVIMLSGHVDKNYLERALDCGAWGYLSKAEETAVLIDSIHRASRGEIVLGKEVRALQRSADHAR